MLLDEPVFYIFPEDQFVQGIPTPAAASLMKSDCSGTVRG